MACPTTVDFQALIVDEDSSVCDQLRKLGRLAQTVSDAYACIYNADGTLTTEFTDKICATGCGGDATTSSTTSGGGGSGQQLYTTSGTYEFVVPAGVVEVQLVAVGGGGGGGGLNIPFAPVPCGVAPIFGVASGGGSGESRSGSYTVTPGETLTVVVGAGGGQTNPTQQGNPGTESYVLNGAATVLTLANPGGGGAWGCCLSGPFTGGAGGTGGTGGTATNGNAGGDTTASPGCANGSGGASVALFAGGGSAGSPNNSGQHTGTAGAVRITW